MDPPPFGQQNVSMGRHNRQCATGVASGHSMILTDGDRVQFNHDLAPVLPAMNVRRLMIPRVDLHAEAVFA